MPKSHDMKYDTNQVIEVVGVAACHMCSHPFDPVVPWRDPMFTLPLVETMQIIFPQVLPGRASTTKCRECLARGWRTSRDAPRCLGQRAP
jgi:hypothetical protein